MKKHLVVMLFFVLFSALSLWAHDPRTTAKEVGVSLSVEGSGNLLVRYKTMHFNQPVYERMKASVEFRDRMNTRIWNNIGTAQFDFDVAIGTETIPKGTYQFGLNIDAGDQFSLVFSNGEITRRVPLTIESGTEVPYLTLALTPTDAPDTFALEGRCGTFRGTASLKIPALGEHHPH